MAQIAFPNSIETSPITRRLKENTGLLINATSNFRKEGNSIEIGDGNLSARACILLGNSSSVIPMPMIKRPIIEIRLRRI